MCGFTAYLQCEPPYKHILGLCVSRWLRGGHCQHLVRPRWSQHTPVQRRHILNDALLRVMRALPRLHAVIRASTPCQICTGCYGWLSFSHCVSHVPSNTEDHTLASYACAIRPPLMCPQPVFFTLTRNTLLWCRRSSEHLLYLLSESPSTGLDGACSYGGYTDSPFTLYSAEDSLLDELGLKRTRQVILSSLHLCSNASRSFRRTPANRFSHQVCRFYFKPSSFGGKLRLVWAYRNIPSH